MTENVKILALRLLDKFDEHISAQLILLHYNATGVLLIYFDFGKGPIGFTGLHGAAFLGIVEIFAAALEMKEWDVNAMDITSRTPLMWAALRGHEGVVKALLERGDINPNLVDDTRRLTPLSWAALMGCEGVVKVFLEQEDVNPDGIGTQYNPTPLFSAAVTGNAGVIKILLERKDVNPNWASSWYDTTPLWVAIELGHEGAVKILLEREDINPNLADTRYGYTPLSLAAKNGRERIVKMLLERNDILINIRDNKNQTPQLLALSQGHNNVARMISERAGAKSNTAGPIIQASLPPSAQYRARRVAETQLRCDHPGTNPADHISQPAPPLADPNAWEGIPHYQGSISNWVDSTMPSTESPRPPPPPLP